jgi:hypothetical protein
VLLALNVEVSKLLEVQVHYVPLHSIAGRAAPRFAAEIVCGRIFASTNSYLLLMNYINFPTPILLTRIVLCYRGETLKRFYCSFCLQRLDASGSEDAQDLSVLVDDVAKLFHPDSLAADAYDSPEDAPSSSSSIIVEDIFSEYTARLQLHPSQRAEISQRRQLSLAKWMNLRGRTEVNAHPDPTAATSSNFEDTSKNCYRRGRKFYAQNMIEINTSKLGETKERLKRIL